MSVSVLITFCTVDTNEDQDEIRYVQLFNIDIDWLDSILSRPKSDVFS